MRCFILLFPGLVSMVLTRIPTFPGGSHSGLNGYTFEGWNSNNVSNLCNWYGVYCNNNGRVDHLYLEPPLEHNVNGTIASSLALLTDMTELGLANMYLTGNVPDGIWALPKIRYVVLRKMAATLQFPPNTSPTLEQLFLSSVQFRGPIADVLNWTASTKLTMLDTGIVCPLPEGLLSRMRSGQYTRCSFSNPLLDVVGGKICGQIPVEEFQCEMFPTAIPIRPDPSDVVEGKETIFTARYKSIQIDFERYDAKIYAVMPNGTVFREEYIQLNFQPIWLEHSDTERMDGFKMSYLYGFEWINSTSVHAKATMTSWSGKTMTATYIFDFGGGGGIQVSGTGLKLTIDVQNNDYVWKAPRGVLSFLVIYRAQHSPEGGLPIYCGPFSAKNVDTMCTSPVATVGTTFERYNGYLGGITKIAMTTAKMFLSFSFALIGEVDGQPLTTENSVIGIMRYLNGLGFNYFLDVLKTLNQTDAIPRAGPALSQSWSLPFQVAVDRWENLRFDPDIELRLLFDLGDAPAQAEVNIGLAVGLGASAVVVIAGVILLFLLVPSLRAKVAPFFGKRQRTIPQNDLELQNEGDEALLRGTTNSASRSTGKWSAGAIPTTTIDAE